MRRRPVSVEQFDPTDNELEQAERARPTRVPLCIRCKSARVCSKLDVSLDAQFQKLASILTSPRVARLSRDDVLSLRGLHETLSRAAKGRYCEGCIRSVISFSEEILSKTERLQSL